MRSGKIASAPEDGNTPQCSTFYLSSELIPLKQPQLFASINMNQNSIFSKSFQAQEYIGMCPESTCVHCVTNCLPFSPKFSKVFWCWTGYLHKKRKKENKTKQNSKPQEKHPQELELRHLGEMAEFQNFPFSILKQLMKQNLRKVF